MSDDNITMTLAEAVAAAAFRASHSFWLDVLSDQSAEVGRGILAAMGDDGRFDNWYAHILHADGVLQLVREPAADVWADVYEVRVKTPDGPTSMVRVQAQRLGLVDGFLPDVTVDIADAALADWLDGKSPDDLSES